MSNGWRVWRAFDHESYELCRESILALRDSCHVDGALDVAAFERWLDILIEYRHGEA